MKTAQSITESGRVLLGVTILLTLAGALSSATAQTPSRTVTGSLLVSEGLPEVRIEVGPDLLFVGREEYVLYESADVQRYNFAELDGDRIRRLLVVQFEGYREDTEYTYTVRSDYPVEIGGLVFNHHTESIRLSTFLDRWAGSGTEYERSASHFKEAGLVVPDDLAMSSFVHILPDRRNELIVLYYEDLALTGVTIAERNEHGRAALPDSAAEEIRERALEVFQILTD